jgi:thymidylate synthase
VIQLFEAGDIADERDGDVPCTCTLQFLLRSDRLHMLTYMRSNDAFWGLPHDVFCFTMIQEILARELAVELGTYKHMVGSLHLYNSHADEARLFIGEGWQSTDGMPPMPLGDPWESVQALLDAERQIRAAGNVDDAKLNAVDGYWKDLVRLLQVFRCKKTDDMGQIAALRERMNSSFYSPFIERLAGPE